MSRVNANPIYTGNTFRNLNAIKANNEVKSNVALSDEVELGAAKRSWSGVGCQTLSDGYYKIPVNAGQDEKYCFSYDSRAEVDGKWIFQTAVKHNSGTIRQLSLNLEWLKKNKIKTYSSGMRCEEEFAACCKLFELASAIFVTIRILHSRVEKK